MKLVSYWRDGLRHHGVLEGDTVLEVGTGDLERLVGEYGLTGEWRLPTGPDGPASYPLGTVELAAPLSRPPKLIAVAANYQDHVTESGAPPLDTSRLAPRLFLKPPTTIVGPGAPVPTPAVSVQVDWEAELAVVIGRGGRDIPVDRALAAVAGYTAANDVSARSVDYGFVRDTEDSAVRFFDWLAGKWLDGFCPLGPCVLTADEVDDPQDLEISLEVNGVRRQHASTRHMIFSVAELVAFASRLMTLEPGDVLLTGTPAGVGAATGDFLASGDEMTVRIAGIGELSNRMA